MGGDQIAESRNDDLSTGPVIRFGLVCAPDLPEELEGILAPGLPDLPRHGRPRDPLVGGERKAP